MSKLLSQLLTIFILLLASSTVAEVPQLISYQGRLTDSDGAPVTDSVYSISFSIYPTSISIGAIWTEATTVEVVGGSFVHLLGSVNFLPDGLFTDSSRWLGLTIGTDPEMFPRTHLATVPYTYHALRADTAGYAVSGGSGPWIQSAGSITYSTGLVGIGISIPVWMLDVSGDVNTSSQYKIGGISMLKTTGTQSVCVGDGAGEFSTALYGAYLGVSAGRVDVASDNTFIGAWAGNQVTTGVNNTYLGTRSGHNNISGQENTYIGSEAGYYATGSGNLFLGRRAGYSIDENNKLYIGNDWGFPLIYGDFETKQVGIGTIEPLATLDVQTTAFDAIRGYTSGDEGASGVLGIGTGPANFGVRGTVDGASATGVKGYSSGNQGTGVSGTSEGENGYGVFGSSWNGNKGTGVFGLSMGTEGYGLHGRAPGSSGWGIFGQAEGFNGIGVYGQAEASNGIGVYGQAEASNGIGVRAVATHAGATALVVEGDPGAVWAADFKGNVRIKNHSNVTIVELGEGLDYAEGFNTASSSKIAPGTVMIIDPINVGKLKVSDQAYDSRVAGIVAGANGLGSGVRLGSEMFDLDVALAGRVYCNVDATEAGIEPGDLLTTSAVTGYAMKATDRLLTQGAILGKAMERLKRGEKGQILVLVTLQ